MKIAPYHHGFFRLSKFRQARPSAAKRLGHRLATAPMPPQGSVAEHRWCVDGLALHIQWDGEVCDVGQQSWYSFL